MESKQEILTRVHEYLKKFPEEKTRVSTILDFIQNHQNEDLISRKNFVGHLTASAFIVDETYHSILLLKHKSLNRWLQPGGHIDDTDPSLISAAMREAIEETGLTKESLTLVSNEIFDIDSHAIPANPRKQEPSHLHHDIRFLFKCTNTNSVNFSCDESTDSRWVPFAELKDEADFRWVKEKITLLT